MVWSMWLITTRSVGLPAALMKSATSVAGRDGGRGWTLIAAPVSAAAMRAAGTDLLQRGAADLADPDGAHVGAPGAAHTWPMIPPG